MTRCGPALSLQLRAAAAGRPIVAAMDAELGLLQTPHTGRAPKALDEGGHFWSPRIAGREDPSPEPSSLPSRFVAPTIPIGAPGSAVMGTLCEVSGPEHSRWDTLSACRAHPDAMKQGGKPWVTSD